MRRCRPDRIRPDVLAESRHRTGSGKTRIRRRDDVQRQVDAEAASGPRGTGTWPAPHTAAALLASRDGGRGAVGWSRSGSARHPRRTTGVSSFVFGPSRDDVDRHRPGCGPRRSVGASRSTPNPREVEKVARSLVSRQGRARRADRLRAGRRIQLWPQLSGSRWQGATAGWPVVVIATPAMRCRCLKLVKPVGDRRHCRGAGAAGPIVADHRDRDHHNPTLLAQPILPATRTMNCSPPDMEVHRCYRGYWACGSPPGSALGVVAGDARRGGAVEHRLAMVTLPSRSTPWMIAHLDNFNAVRLYSVAQVRRIWCPTRCWRC